MKCAKCGYDDTDDILREAKRTQERAEANARIIVTRQIERLANDMRGMPIEKAHRNFSPSTTDEVLHGAMRLAYGEEMSRAFLRG